MTSLKKFREMAGLPPEVRRWTQAAAATREKQEKSEAEGWPADVHKGYAIRDGLTPADFRHPWDVSNVHMRHIQSDEYFPSEIAMVYRCDMPAETPHTNQYVEDKSDPTGYRALPDPVGMALSAVIFELRDSDTGEVLDTDLRDHDAGSVTGLLDNGAKALWKRLTPGSFVRVRLAARPKFFYLGEDGGMKGQYSIGNRGYFLGDEVVSQPYGLSMTEEGAILLNGAAAPAR